MIKRLRNMFWPVHNGDKSGHRKYSAIWEDVCS